MRELMALGAILTLAACSTVSEGATDFEAAIRGNSGYTSVHGSADALAAAGTTVVTVNLEGAQPGARHPWHVHRGICGSGGPIVGDASDYPVLEIDGEGKDRETAEIDVLLDDDEDYYVNIHLSPSQAGVIVACGALVD